MNCRVYLTESERWDFIKLMLVKAPWKEDFLIECCRRNGGTYTGRSLAGVATIEFMEVPAEPLPPGPLDTLRASTFWREWMPARFFEMGIIIGGTRLRLRELGLSA